MVLLSTASWLLTHLFGILYPAYKSYKAIESRNVNELYSWLIYWVIYALFSTCQTVADIFIFWIPFYYELKFIAIVWLVSPQTRGALYLYDYHIQPQMKLHYEPEIDRVVLKFQAIAKQKIIEHGRQLIVWAQNGMLYLIFRGRFMVVDSMTPNNSSTNSTPGVSASSSARPSPRVIPSNRIQELPDTDSEDYGIADEEDEEPYIVESSHLAQRRPYYNETQVVPHRNNIRSSSNNVGRIGYARPHQPQQMSSPPRHSSSSSYHAQRSQVVSYPPPSVHQSFYDPAYNYISYEPQVQYQPVRRDEEEMNRLRDERDRLSRLMRDLEEQEERLGRYTSGSSHRYPQQPPSSPIVDEMPIPTNTAARTRYRSTKGKNGSGGGNTSPLRHDEPVSSIFPSTSNARPTTSRISRPFG